jgi:hypothetical protein
MKFIKVLSNLITEDARFQVLYKKYVLPSSDRKKGILPFEIVRDIVFADPTTRPVDYDVASVSVDDMTSDNIKVGKYVQWMLKRFVTPELTNEDGEPIEQGTEEYKRDAVEYRRIFMEDLSEMKSLLAKYDRFKGSLADDTKKNIDNVKSFEELYQLPVKVGDSTVELGKYQGKKFKKEEGKEVNKQFDIPGAEILKVGSEYTLIRISDKGDLGAKAASYFGGTKKGEISNGETNWCTRVEGTHSHNYRQQGPLYIFIANDGSKGVGQITGLPSDRYQLHFPTDQFKNQDQYGAGGSIPIVEWLNGKWSEFKEIFKSEFAKGLTVGGEKLIIDSFSHGALGKYIGIYGFDDLFENLPITLKQISIQNKDKDKITINIPESIGKFKELNMILLDNCVEHIPDSICTLPKLRFLALPDNQKLTTVPECIADLPNLYFLNLKGSQNVNIPEKIKQKGTEMGGGMWDLQE